MLLEVENLNVFYGKAQVVHNVSLNVKAGEMVFLVGRNGAGKTTLMRALTGFIGSEANKVTFSDRDIRTEKTENLARMGLRYVFQDKRVFTRLTVKENILMAAHPFKEDKKVALDKVISIYPKIEEFWDIKAGGLSGGQRQLLLLGRALLGDPKLLLIDEPTEGLAAGIIEDVFKVLYLLKGTVSMLIVEQNLDLVTRLADRIYAIREGSIVKEITEKSELKDRNRLEEFL
ncbi:MAG TPA: ABC transporter ATP-binding protein [Sphaerochaeta sp.]|nr:ABC transporter ATP-binding protein [Sphaerochaeta sp.]HCS37470.1 ABC transporter ATP-binding protein [Sphaerochaeta sp.]